MFFLFKKIQIKAKKIYVEQNTKILNTDRI